MTDGELRKPAPPDQDTGSEPAEQQPSLTSTDSQYLNQLKQAFTDHFPRATDVWISSQLDKFLFPLCQKLAKDTSELSSEEVLETCQSIPPPHEFPNVFLDRIGQQTLHLLLQLYNGNATQEENFAIIKERYEEAKEELKGAQQLLVGKRWSKPEDQPLFMREIDIKEKFLIWENAFKNFEKYVVEFRQYLSASPTIKRQFQESILAPLMASRLESKNFPLSSKSERVTHLSPTNLDQKVEPSLKFLLGLVHLPSFLSDETVTQDLLYTLNVMLTKAVDSQSLASELGHKAPLLISKETARGHNADPQTAMLMILMEGTVSVMQSIAIAAAQLHQDYQLDISDEELIKMVVENKVPTQIARYLPAGHLGPATLGGYYIEHLFILDKNEITFNPILKQKGQERKQQNRDHRNNLSPLQSYGTYIANTTNVASLTMYSGLVCPVSRPHSEEIELGTPESGIDLLSAQFLKVFQQVRELRKNKHLSV